MKSEFFCKFCLEWHGADQLAGEHNGNEICKAKVALIAKRKETPEKKIKPVSKVDIEKLLNQRADKRRKIESILEQRQLEKSLNYYEEF